MTTEEMEARIAELEKELSESKDNEEMSNGCFIMIYETLSAYIPMEGCPPMMYNDAIRNLVAFMYWQGSSRANPPEGKAAIRSLYKQFTKHRSAVIQAKANEGKKATLRDLAIVLGSTS
jgi:hypothetical protein